MNKTKYNFLPFRFLKNKENVLLTNDVGDYYFLTDNDFNSFIHHELESNSEIFFDLKSKGFLYDNFLPNVIEIQSTKYRTKNRFLYDFTSLHMFVVTLRCSQKCTYCHASSQNEFSGNEYDMTPETARKCVEFMFHTPSPYIKVEFQGGEPLLNFDTVKVIVAARNRNGPGQE